MKGIKYLNWTNYILSGTLIIILSASIMIGNQNLYEKVITFMVYIFLLLGISQLLSVLFKDKKKFKKQDLILACGNLLFGIIMVLFPGIPLSILPLLFAFYLLFNFLIKGVDYLISRANHLSTKWMDLFLSIFYLIAGVSFLFSPLGHLPTLLSIMGFYGILLGLSEYRELLKEILPNRYKKKIKRSFRITLPVFLEAFMPRKMLNDVNHYFNDLKEINESDYAQEKEEEKCDLEIFIHLSPIGFNQFGHMDFYFDGKIISYGNYDNTSLRLFDSIGDGVLFESDRKSYIPFVIKQSEKTLIGFGLRLTEDEKKRIRKELDKVKENAYTWYSIAQRDLSKKIIKKVDEYEDYASVLYLETKKKTKFYKFHEGPFKTYFVLGTNCTAFADRIVGKSGTDLLKMVGLITPGTYLDYLDHEFHKKNSKVISKTIYNDATKEKAMNKNKKKTFKKKKSMLE